MKVWKKTLCMVLCLSMMTSVVGCDNFRNAFSSASEENDSIAESTDETTSVTEDEADDLADSYYNGLLATAEDVKSFKASLSVVGEYKAEYIGEDGEIDDEMTESDNTELTLDIVVSETDAGMTLKLYGEIKGTYYDYSESDNGEACEYTDVIELVVTPDYTYQRNYEIYSSMTQEEVAEAKATKWYKSEMTVDEELVTSVNEVFALLPEGFIDKVLATKEVEQAGEMLVSAGKDALKEAILAGANNGGVSYEEDFAGKANEIITFLEGIDEEKDTLGKVINHALTAVAPGLTTGALLGAIKDYTQMTVSEALTEIDKLLMSTYQTDLQTVKDAIVNSEIANVFFVDGFGLDAETIQSIKDWKVASLKEGEYKDEKLADLINTFLIEYDVVTPPEEGETPDYCAEMLDMAEAALEATLAELGITLPSFKGVNIEEVKISNEMQFSDTYWVESLSDVISLKWEVTDYDEAGVAEDYITFDLQLVWSVTEISDKAVVIEMPDADDIIEIIHLNGQFDEEGTLEIDSDEYGVCGTLQIFDDEGNYVYTMGFSCDDILEAYGEEMWVEVNCIDDVTYSEEETTISEMSEIYYQENCVYFTLTLNADGTYDVEGIPTLAEIAEWYNTDYGETNNESGDLV